MRVPQLFSIPDSNNSVSQNDPISRIICRQYNAMYSQVDIFYHSDKIVQCY